MDRQGHEGVGEVHDGREVRQRIVGHALEEGQRARHRLGADVAAGSRLVLNHRRLSPPHRELLAQEPRQSVWPRSRRERDDDGDGSRLLRHGGGACGQERSQRQAKTPKGPASLPGGREARRCGWCPRAGARCKRTVEARRSAHLETRLHLQACRSIWRVPMAAVKWRASSGGARGQHHPGRWPPSPAAKPTGARSAGISRKAISSTPRGGDSMRRPVTGSATGSVTGPCRGQRGRRAPPTAAQGPVARE
jgi:hypothetical protein